MSDNTQPKRFQCRHIHADGRRCGSPALRTQEFCFYHHTSRKPAPHPRTRRGRQAAFELALPDANDRTGLQLAIAEVLCRIASNQLDPRRAGLLLYGLQIASINLPQARRAPAQALEAEPVEEIVLDPTLGALAPRAELAADGPGARHQSLTERLLAELARGRAELEDSTARPGCKARCKAGPQGSHTPPDGPATPQVIASLDASTGTPAARLGGGRLAIVRTSRPDVPRYATAQEKGGLSTGMTNMKQGAGLPSLVWGVRVAGRFLGSAASPEKGSLLCS